MTLSQINYLNVGLMLLALVVAFALPFETFLFSYAVLGPLHYVTEIGWLRKKNYFTQHKNDHIPLIVLAVLFTIIYLYISYLSTLDPRQLRIRLGPDALETKKTMSYWMANIILATFVVGVTMVFTRVWWARALGIVGGLLMGSFLTNLGGDGQSNYFVLVAILVPTLIHVFVFTGLFMLYGSIKSKSVIGYVSVGLLLACGAACFLIPVQPEIFELTPNGMPILEGARSTYSDVGFHGVNASVIHYVTGEPTNFQQMYFSKLGVQVQRFIAFAYTYHYLNWFSKTSIIGWHKVPKKNLIVALSIWVAAVLLYLYDYIIGLNALLFLSVLHVFLEFPLNVQSVAGIFGYNRGKKETVRITKKAAG